MSLMLSGTSVSVSYDELKDVPVPPPTKTWFPIRHHEVVDIVKRRLHVQGHRVVREEHGLNGQYGGRYFGMLHLDTQIHDGVKVSVGLRNSFDKSMSAGGVLGEGVLVCDNMSFGGAEHSWMTLRRHTRNILSDLPNRMRELIAGLDPYVKSRRQFHDGLSQQTVTDSMFNDLLIDSIDRGSIGWRDAPVALNTWRAREGVEYQGERINWDDGKDTAWRAFNAFTWALKRGFTAGNSDIAANKTIKLNQQFTNRFVDTKVPEYGSGYESQHVN